MAWQAKVAVVAGVFIAGFTIGDVIPPPWGPIIVLGVVLLLWRYYSGFWRTAASGLAAVATWVGLSAGEGTTGALLIDGWRITVAYLAVAGAVIVALAPNIRRFARSFIDDVFHMTPEIGGRFIAVLDIAYYTFFTGLLLVDADSWTLTDKLRLGSAIDDLAARVGFLLLAMGALHAVNLAMLPILGLIHASTVRRDLRRRAGRDVPAESMAAKRADSAARGFAVALVTLAVAIVISFLIGAPGLLSLESLG